MVYRAQSTRQIGVTNIVIGGLMIILGIACIPSVRHWSSFVGFGIWVGVWVLITGILAYLGARDNNTPNKCILGTMIGFAVTGCVITGVMVICYAVSLAEFSHYVRCNTNYGYPRHYPYGCGYYHHWYMSHASAKAGVGLGSLLLILSITGFFVGLASSIYGCNACCCAPSVRATATQQVVYLPQQQGQPGVVVVGPHGAMAGATTIQTFQATYPGQQGMVIQQQGQPQQQIAWMQQPQPRQGYPVQGGYAAAAPQQPQQAYQEKGEMPPPYTPGQ